MEKTFHGLAEDTRREQTHRVKLKGRGFAPREVHHTAGKSGIGIVENKSI